MSLHISPDTTDCLANKSYLHNLWPRTSVPEWYRRITVSTWIRRSLAFLLLPRDGTFLIDTPSAVSCWETVKILIWVLPRRSHSSVSAYDAELQLVAHSFSSSKWPLFSPADLRGLFTHYRAVALWQRWRVTSGFLMRWCTRPRSAGHRHRSGQHYETVFGSLL